MDQQQPATGNPIDLSRLAAKFPASEIEWRTGRAGEKNGKIWATALPFITNRAIMARLDEVCGPENWKNEFKPGPLGGVVCGISIRVHGEWVCKWDGADNTDVESVKGGLSDAMKRAGVQWSIGRYLYDLNETWAVVAENGEHFGSFKDQSGKVVKFRWNTPPLPASALPAGEQPKVVEAQPPKTAQQPMPTKKEQPKTPDAATVPQVRHIEKLAAQILMDVEKDILVPRGISSKNLLTKSQASSIITSLKAKLGAMPPRNKKQTEEDMTQVERRGMKAA